MKGVMKNPLVDEPERPAAKEKRRAGQFIDEFEIPLVRDLRTVAFPGRTLTISIEAEGDEAEKGAKDTLGVVLGEYIKIHPELFAAQNLSTKSPLDPAVTFQLGGLTLYAVAGSTVADTARKMAVDRLAVILTAAKATPVGRALLAKHRVTVSRRA